MPDRGRKAVDLTIAVPTGANFSDAFVEGPDGWFFGAPVVLTTEPDKVTIRVPIEDRPKTVTAAVPLVVTLTGAQQASEVRFDLDIPPPRP